MAYGPVFHSFLVGMGEGGGREGRGRKWREGAGTFPVPLCSSAPLPVQGVARGRGELGQGPRWGTESGGEAERIAGEGGVGI